MLKEQLFLLLFLVLRLNAQDENCTDVTCATNAVCMDGECSCESPFFSPTRSNTDCRSSLIPAPECQKYDPDCVFCGSQNEGPSCLWCTNFLSQDTCVANCTGETKFVIIPTIGLTSPVCEPDTSGSTSIPQWAIIVIIIVGILILVTGALIFIILMVRALNKTSRGVFEVETTTRRQGGDSIDGTMRTKRSNSFSFSFQKMMKGRAEVHQNLYSTHSTDLGPTYDEQTEEHDEEDIEGDDEDVFKYKVDKLRPQSEVFLQMLNDMRRRSKELPQGSPEEEQYRKVMRDVTRLLYILNKKPSRLKMPPDGVELMRWSEKILRKYKASQEKEGTMERASKPMYMSSGHTGTSDENVFLGKLVFLRDHSDTFLRMLNELRRKLKQLRPEIPITRNYRAISKDLTRLLELMNKDQDDVEMPQDGLQLVNKAENLLENYLAGQGFIMNYEEDSGLDPYREDTTDF